MAIPLRRLPLLSMRNFRDLGGYSAGGGVTRYRRLYRADCPAELTQADIEAIKAAGVRTSVDMRSDREVARQPSSLANVPDIDYHRVSLFGNIETLRAYLDVQPETSIMGDLESLYVALAEVSHEQIVSIFRLIALSLPYGAVLVHCTAGKDRTGIISALLLLLCGVSTRDVLVDYSMTRILLEPSVVPWPVGGESNALLSSDPATIAHFATHLDRAYGGVENYLREHGLLQSDIDSIVFEMVEKE